MTKIIKITKEADLPLILPAARALAAGEIVGMPTETVYGLGGNAFLPEAVKKIFEVKGRPQDNPLIAHISDRKMLDLLCEHIPDKAELVMDKFWPGPLTIIMKKKKAVPDIVTAGLDTVAIRMPSHPAARFLIEKSGVPVVAPSANTSGRPSPTCCEHVLEDLGGKIPYILDGGSCDIGLESTVLDLTCDVPQILRPGGISLEMLTEVFGEVIYDPGIIKKDAAPKSPGMKYRHYAPYAPMYIVESDDAPNVIKKLTEESKKEGKKTGVLSMSGTKYDADFVINIPPEPEGYAAALFAALRKFDSLGADIIYAEMFEGQSGIKAAIKNRIYKAAGGKVIK